MTERVDLKKEAVGVMEKYGWHLLLDFVVHFRDTNLIYALLAIHFMHCLEKSYKHTFFEEEPTLNFKYEWIYIAEKDKFIKKEMNRESLQF